MYKILQKYRHLNIDHLSAHSALFFFINTKWLEALVAFTMIAHCLHHFQTIITIFINMHFALQNHFWPRKTISVH